MYIDPDGKDPFVAMVGFVSGFVEGLGNSAIGLATSAIHPIRTSENARDTIIAASQGNITRRH